MFVTDFTPLRCKFSLGENGKRKKRKICQEHKGPLSRSRKWWQCRKKRKYFPFRSRGFFFILLISRPYLAVNSMRARDEKKKGKYKEKENKIGFVRVCQSHIHWFIQKYLAKLFKVIRFSRFSEYKLYNIYFQNKLYLRKVQQFDISTTSIDTEYTLYNIHFQN